MNSLALNTGLLWVTLGAFGALAAGTLVRLRAVQGAAADEAKKRMDSLRSWWIVAILVALASFLGTLGVTVLMGLVSWMALREFLRLVGTQESDHLAVTAAFGMIPATYALVFWGWDGVANFLLLGLLLVVGSLLVGLTETKGFVRAASTLCWGVIVTVYSLSHVPMLLIQSSLPSPAVGHIGLFLFLILLTETNDIAQALVGRRIGRHKITPVVSPNKTWEGLAGGLIVTTLCALLLRHWLLPTGAGVGLGAVLGLAISVAGFLGDIHMSALKRDVGVKDSGNLLPGQGGILDRIDSLTFTAPTFFYLVIWLFNA